MCDGPAIRLFVSADKSQVRGAYAHSDGRMRASNASCVHHVCVQCGKTSVCLGLLGALLRAGFRASELAYIKPATQCEEEQLIWRFCAANSAHAPKYKYKYKIYL